MNTDTKDFIKEVLIHAISNVQRFGKHEKWEGIVPLLAKVFSMTFGLGEGYRRQKYPVALKVRCCSWRRKIKHHAFVRRPNTVHLTCEYTFWRYRDFPEELYPKSKIMEALPAILANSISTARAKKQNSYKSQITISIENLL